MCYNSIMVDCVKNNDDLISLIEARTIASSITGRTITSSNISYLIQYGLIQLHSSNGNSMVSKAEIVNYYSLFDISKENKWKNTLGEDLNWALSFDKLAESERTKHVHRLHPYKGKFIPQLVEYFLDNHTDSFKKEAFFKEGDIIYDPFCGSGTTLVQANELGLNAIGVDISAFNAMITNVKVDKHDLIGLANVVASITRELSKFSAKNGIGTFDLQLSKAIVDFNKQYFPVPKYRSDIRSGIIDEKEYGVIKEQQFLQEYNALKEKFNISVEPPSDARTFSEKWFNNQIKQEIDFVFDKIRSIDDKNIKKVLAIILSRTMRSCRATTHEDLATLIEPVFTPYYCKKHRKICKPLYTITGWWKRYSIDSINRLSKFNSIRTNTFQHCFTGDSRNIDLLSKVEPWNVEIKNILSQKKISGIFSSPPYVGLIDYHEQHAYAYDIFGFQRRDDFEIGPLSKGQTIEAREQYVLGIADVLINSRKFLKDEFNIFLVANDKYNLYPRIVDLAGMKIVNQYKRPVLNRTEKNKSPYSEIIFHIKEK